MYTCITIKLVESVLGVKPGQSHTLGLEQLMDQYFANIVLKLSAHFSAICLSD